MEDAQSRKDRRINARIQDAIQMGLRARKFTSAELLAQGLEFIEFSWKLQQQEVQKE